MVTGLRKFVPEGELKDAMVLTIINLKVAKLAGQTSEAMILATEFEADGEQKVKLVKVPKPRRAARRDAGGHVGSDDFPEGVQEQVLGCREGKARCEGRQGCVR